jgi:hypothetical protein
MSLWNRYEPSPDAPWNMKRVVHLHRRAAFGATWNEIQRDLGDTPQAAIGRVLTGTCRSEGVPAEQLGRGRALRRMGQDLFAPPNVGGWPGGKTSLSTQTVIARGNAIADFVGGRSQRASPAVESGAAARASPGAGRPAGDRAVFWRTAVRQRWRQIPRRDRHINRPPAGPVLANSAGSNRVAHPPASPFALGEHPCCTAAASSQSQP